MIELNKYKLSDIAEVFTGFPFKGDKYCDFGGVKVLRGENVSLGYLRWDTTKCWNEPFSEIEKYSLRKDDIVVGMDGSRVGRNRAQIKEIDLPLLLAQRVARIRAFENFNQNLLSYIIKSDRFENYVSAVHTGTSIPHISATQINNFEFEAPSEFTYQKEIASILSSLDNKIELNLQINQTLESMAKVIFKEWFINFNFPGFDGELVEGLPKGWRKNMIKEVGLVVTGNTPSSNNPEYFGDSIPFITPTDFKYYGKLVIDAERYLSNEGKVALVKKLLPKNSVIVTCIGSDMGKVAIAKVECISNQQINSIIPDGKIISPDYLYYDLVFKYEYLRNIATGGSTMPIINKSRFEEIEIVVPSFEVIESFQLMVESLNIKIEESLRQIKTLTQIRDSLLPKLMTGKIEIKN